MVEKGQVFYGMWEISDIYEATVRPPYELVELQETLIGERLIISHEYFEFNHLRKYRNSEKGNLYNVFVIPNDPDWELDIGGAALMTNSDLEIEGEYCIMFQLGRKYFSDNEEPAAIVFYFKDHNTLIACGGNGYFMELNKVMGREDISSEY